MEKVENLITALNNTSTIKELEEINKKVEKDLELKKLLEEYSLTKKEELKKRIIENKTFQEYKEKEKEVNLLIMDINQRLKKIKKKEDCSL